MRRMRADSVKDRVDRYAVGMSTTSTRCSQYASEPIAAPVITRETRRIPTSNVRPSHSLACANSSHDAPNSVPGELGDMGLVGKQAGGDMPVRR